MESARTTYDSLTRFFVEGPVVAPFITGHRAAGKTGVSLVRMSNPSGFYPNPVVPDVALHLVTGGRTTTQVRLGERPFAMPTRRGTMVLAPPGAECSYRVAGPYGLVSVILPQAMWRPFVEEAGGRADGFGAAHAGWFEDPFVEQLCHRMWREAESGNPHGVLFADGATVALAAAMLRLSGQPNRLGLNRGGLAPWRLRRALDLLAASLDKQVGVAELAAAAGLSEGYFSRAFRTATGEAPYAYALRRRVERAQELLLADPNLPVTEVALACGFVDQAHLTKAFRARVGLPPAAWRRAQLR